jgi:transposase
VHGLQSVKKGAFPRHISRMKGRLNIKFHAIFDGNGRPMLMCLTASQVSDHIGAKILYPGILDRLQATLIGNNGYDSTKYRAALRGKGITVCILPRRGRMKPAAFCKTQKEHRHKVESMFGLLTDWRRIATRYDRQANIFMAAITIPTILTCWI